eukprot:3403459-Amphidinium_carterae.2
MGGGYGTIFGPWRMFYMLKFTMLSGRSTVVAACDYQDSENILAACCSRLGLANGTIMEFWHGSERVPLDARLSDWPGIRPLGELSEYQLVAQ